MLTKKIKVVKQRVHIMTIPSKFVKNLDIEKGDDLECLWDRENQSMVVRKYNEKYKGRLKMNTLKNGKEVDKSFKHFCHVIDDTYGDDIFAYLVNTDTSDLRDLYKEIESNWSKEKYEITFNNIKLKGQIKVYLFKQLVLYVCE